MTTSLAAALEAEEAPLAVALSTRAATLGQVSGTSAVPRLLAVAGMEVPANATTLLAADLAPLEGEGAFSPTPLFPN